MYDHPLLIDPPSATDFVGYYEAANAQSGS